MYKEKGMTLSTYYDDFGQTMTAYTLSAIDHIDETTSANTILEIMDRTSAFANGGVISSEQFAQIKEALLSKTGKSIPEDTETEDMVTLKSLSEDVEYNSGAIEELGDIVTDIINN